MKIFAEYACYAMSGLALLLCSTFAFAQEAQESITMDMVESDAIQYTNQKQVGRIAPFISLGSYEIKSNGDNSGIKPNQRFGVGAMVTVLSGKINLETGLAYMPVGARFETKTSSGLSVDMLLDLEYVAVPVIAKTFFRPNKTGLFFKAGLVPAYLMKASSDVKISQGNMRGNSGSSVTERFKPFDLQGTIGVGAQFETDMTNRVFLDLSWGRSLTPVSENTSVDIYNEGFLMTAGLTL